MNILTIPLRTMRKKWLKTSLLFTVFTLSVVAIVSLNYVSREVGHSLEKKLTAFGANILVTPRSEKLTVSYGGFSLGDMLMGMTDLREADVEERILSIGYRDRISVVAPKLVSMARVGDVAVGVVGVRFEREKVLKGYWSMQGDFPAAENGVLAGSKAAARLGLKVGDGFDLAGRPAVVSGILDPTGSDDDSVMFANLGFAQSAFGQEGKVSFVEVAALCAGCPIEDIVRQLEEKLPDTEIQAMQSIVKQRMYSVHFVEHLILTVSLVILFIACCMVGATMLSSVNERIREIGLLRSLGFSRAGIFGVFCFEAALIGLAAGVVGYFGGFFLSVEVLDLLGMAQEAEAAMHAGHLLLTCALIVGVSVLAAFFPSWKAASIEPSTALISL
ncbi:FtsX-like permease family protein [anaerobic digester metagenome]